MSDQNHEVQVVALKAVRPHTNADRLQLATIFGNQIVVGLDHKDGDLGIYFNCDLQLSEEFAKANDLVKRKDDEGNPAGGMFEENRRVKCQKLRGEKSDGFFIPLSSLEFAGSTAKLKVGDSFSEFNGTPICYKYVSKLSKSCGKGGLGKHQAGRKNCMFNEHKSTSHAGRNMHQIIDTNARIVITEKLHGTSQRYGRVLVERELTWLEKQAQKFLSKYIKVQDTMWGYMNGTRRVVIRNVHENGNAPHQPQLRDMAVEPFKDNLHKGEVIYFEVVGFTPEGKPIMPSVDTKKMRDKAFTKQFANVGDKRTMQYSYGCEEKQHDVYVYRITQVNESGKEFELSWDHVKKRCDELGVKYTPEVFAGSVEELIRTTLIDDCEDEVSEENLLRSLDNMSEGESIVDPSHVREGICIRLDGSEWVVFKHKSFTFKTLESIEKDSGVENMEDQS
ncbi:RNA ligase domain protein [Vibrio phage 2.275.O._10N.286.54.E11]|nr:RNA ligase domain protein [Vibrio phage 2.275.O._10N.286.54.E11]